MKKIKVGGNFIQAKECNSWASKFMGLMFKSDMVPLIFRFRKPISIAIHSFFVKTSFLAIWGRGERIVERRIVRPWTLHVRPKEKFDSLLEIPFSNEDQISAFLDGGKKGLKTL